jgi:hypothetical protein
MQLLLAEKPREDAADIRDVEAIAYAETHMGDYKLKSSPSYEVRVEEGVRVVHGEREGRVHR